MRLIDWRTRLTDYLAASARRPFAEGEHDCALFAAGAVEAMTGRDPAADWRGRYRSTRAGLKALRLAGHADPAALTAAFFDEIPPAFAQAGDLVTVPAGEAGAPPALGIVQGAMVCVLTPGGLGLVPMTGALRAFRVA